MAHLPPDATGSQPGAPLDERLGDQRVATCRLAQARPKAQGQAATITRSKPLRLSCGEPTVCRERVLHGISRKLDDLRLPVHLRIFEGVQGQPPMQGGSARSIKSPDQLECLANGRNDWGQSAVPLRAQRFHEIKIVSGNRHVGIHNCRWIIPECN